MLLTRPSASGINYVGQLSPAAWFRYGVGITSSSGLVSQWDDQSGNGRHLLQATGTNQPTLEANGSITFDGVDNFLKCDAFTLNQPETFYLLLQQVSWSAEDGFCDGNAAGSAIIYNGPAPPSVSPNIQLYAGSDAASNSDLAVGAYGVVSAVFNGASSLLQVNTNASTTGNPGAANAGGFTLGCRANPTGFGNIQVKEVILYAAAHDADTRNRVIRYLAHVGGLAV